MLSPCSQLLFHVLGVQDIPASSCSLICNVLDSVIYKIAPLHIFKEMFEIIKMLSFPKVIYYPGVKDQMTGHNCLQIFYIYSSGSSAISVESVKISQECLTFL